MSNANNPLLVDVVCPDCGTYTEYNMLNHAKTKIITCEHCKAVFTSNSNATNMLTAIKNLKVKNAKLFLAADAMLSDYRRWEHHRKLLADDMVEAMRFSKIRGGDDAKHNA